MPHKKFLRDSLISLLRCGKPIVCQMARHIPNQKTKFLSRLDRLESHLVKNNDFDCKIKSELPDKWLPFIKDDTPVILDLSDIAKPYAKKMDYLADQIPTPYRFDKIVKRRGKKKSRITQIGFIKVKLPSRDETLTIIFWFI